MVKGRTVGNLSTSTTPEEALRKIEQEKLAILNSISEHVVYQDTEHRILWANKAAAESVDLPPEQLVGCYCYEIWPQRSEPCVGCPVAKARESGKPQETEITTPDGRAWFIRGYPMRDANDRVVGVVEVTLDITERKRMEDALQAEKNKLQSVIDAMEDGLTIQDKDFNIIYQNELVRKIFGDQLREKCYLVYEGREKMCDGCPVEKAFKDGKSHTSERRVVIPSGEVTFWENTANPIRDAEGKIVSCLEINRNITERKQAEEALRDSEEKLWKMFESVTDGISVIDLNGIITEVNQRTVEMHGFGSRDELLGKNAFELIAPRDHEKIATNMRQALKQGIIRGVEYTLLKADGSEFPGELSTSVLKDASGNLVGHITIARDITKRKQGLEALERTSKDLWLVNLINNAANQGYSLQRILQLVTHETKRIFSGYEATFYHISEDKKYLIIQNLNLPQAVVSSIEKLIGMKIPPARIRLQEGSLYLKALQADKPQIINDPEAIQRLMAECTENKLLKKLVPRIYKLLDLHSVIQVPLVSEGEVIGLLDISRKEPFTELELERFATIAQQLLIIIERKRAEETIHQQNEFLNNILDSLTHPFYVIDANDYTIKMANLAAGLGNLSENPTCYSLTHKNVKPCGDVDHVCPLEEVKRTKKPVVVEHIHYDEDGNVRNIEVNGYPIFDTEGNVIQMIEYCLDITERKQAEEALADEVTRRRILVEQSLDGIVVLDENAKVYEANQRFAEMLGYTPEEVRELHTWDWDTQWSREELLEMGRKVDETGFQVETYHRRKDGTNIDVEISINGAVFAGKKLIFCVCRDITERKRAEETLRESQKFSSSLLENSPNPIFVINPDTSVRYVNPAFEKLTGLTLAEITGRKAPYPWWPEEKREEMTAAFKNAMVTGGRRSERIFQKKNGERFWVALNSAPIVHEGKLIYFLINWLDITERKQAEEKFENLVEATSDMIWEADETGTFTFVSPRIKDILGYEVNEIVGKRRTLDFTPKVEARKWLNRFKEISAKRVPFSGFEITHLHKNGNHVVFETSGIPLFDSAGNFKGFTGINKDITERKQAEEKIESAAEEWRTTFDSITDFISIHDRDNRIVRVNKAFADALKTTPKKLIGKVCHQLMHGTKEPPANCPHRQTLKTGKPATIEVFEPNLGIYVQESASPIFDEKGEVAGSVHITKNITERKRMEEQLMLTDRLASIGELASGIAHELNNPLTSVIGFSQLLMEENIPDNLKEDLGTIYSEAQRAASIVKNLLTFARKHAPMRQLSQINTIIEDVLRLRAYEHKVNNIEVDTRFATNLPEIMVDYFQMQQVFLNIIVNAESAMLGANGRGKLVITTGRINNVIKVTIADDGPGIARENLRRVFDPFFTTKEVGKGTGLGLSICHGIVTGHGGRIYAESEISKGATFAVELPVDSR